MLLTYREEQVIGAPYDLCASALMVLNCDGTPSHYPRTTPTPAPIPYDPQNPTEPTYLAQPIQFALMPKNVNTVLTPEVAAALEEEDESGQANSPAVKVRVPARNTGYTGSIQGSALINPIAMALLDAAAPVEDANNSDKVHGIEEAVSVTAACPTCARAVGTCQHSLALYTFHTNRNKGDNITDSEYPYWAVIQKSIQVEASSEALTFGRGFNQLSYSYLLKSNPNFVDPFGIDSRTVGTNAKWSILAVSNTAIDASADLQEILDSCA